MAAQIGKQLFRFCIILFMFTFGVGPGWANDFPLRAKYPGLEPITTSALAAVRTAKEAVVIDVRTKAEFDAMHIKGAINVPHILTDANHELLKAAAKEAGKYLVFYCNGVLCSKSYKAAEIAKLLGFKGVRNYDAGIFAWAETYPEETVFFGDLLRGGNAQRNLIAQSEFKKALVDTLTFVSMAKSGDYEVYDLRDAREKAEYPMELPRMSAATLDQLHELLQDGKFPKSNVLLFDNVGRQVVWAQYYLERFGIKNYHFLDGGVAKWRADGRDSKGDELGKVFGKAKRK